MRNLTKIARRNPNVETFTDACFGFASAHVKGVLVEQGFGSLNKQRADAAMFFLRAAISPAKTAQSGWASELVTPFIGDFLADPSTPSAMAQVVKLGSQVDLGAHRTGIFPAQSGALPTATFTNEADQSPVVARSLTTVEIERRKMVSIITTSRELLARSTARQVFETMLREEIGGSYDAAFLSSASGSGAPPKGLLNGVSPITGSTAGGREAMVTDLSALVAAIAGAGYSGVVAYVMPHLMSSRLLLLAPDLYEKLNAYGTSALPAGQVVAIDAAALVSATGEAELDWAKHAVLHLEDTTPLAIGTAGSPNTVAAPAISMFQTAQSALRVLADLAFATRRSGAVAYATGCDWGL